MKFDVNKLWNSVRLAHEFLTRVLGRWVCDELYGMQFVFSKYLIQSTATGYCTFELESLAAGQLCSWPPPPWTSPELECRVFWWSVSHRQVRLRTWTTGSCRQTQRSRPRELSGVNIWEIIIDFLHESEGNTVVSGFRNSSHRNPLPWAGGLVGSPLARADWMPLKSDGLHLNSVE